MRTTDDWSHRSEADECCRGHPLTGDNVRQRKEGRICVTCQRACSRLHLRLRFASRMLAAHVGSHGVHATPAGKQCAQGEQLLAKRNAALEALHTWQLAGRPRRAA